jgi:hypothetical protein
MERERERERERESHKNFTLNAIEQFSLITKCGRVSSMDSLKFY